jgi:hypothetical protein
MGHSDGIVKVGQIRVLLKNMESGAKHGDACL